MKATNNEISQHFSEGDFPFCYEYFSNDIEWKLVGGQATKGRENVISYCDKMMVEMAGSVLKNTNVISGDTNVAIEGICSYTSADNQPAEVLYCDVFHFDNGKISSITSYCIEKKL